MLTFWSLLRLLEGYLFVIPLLIQAFFLHPSYERSANAKLLRAGLMPVTIYLALSRLKYRLIEPLDEFFHVNFTVVTFVTFHSVCLAFQFGLFTGSVFPPEKLGEIDRRSSDEVPSSNRIDTRDTKQSTIPASLGEKVKFTVWLLASPRGIGTSWAPSVTPLGPKMSALRFLAGSLVQGLIDHILFIACWTIGVSFAQDPRGPLGFVTRFWQAPDWLEYYASFLLPLPFAGAAWSAIDELGCAFNIIECIFYHVAPFILPKSFSPGRFDSRLYPALFNKLGKRENLTELWSKGWHSIFRRDIVFCGWKPAAYALSFMGKDVSRTAGTLGAMFFSGIFHEFVLAAASNLDPTVPTINLFLLSGIGMVLEELFQRFTGRPVRGLGGRLWLSIMLFLPGRNVVISWVERGLGRNGIPPISYWGWPRFFLPYGAILPERWISLFKSSSWRPDFIEKVLKIARLLED